MAALFRHGCGLALFDGRSPVTEYRPTGWHPTAFYFPNGSTTAYTAAAILDPNGAPVEAIDDPADRNGIQLIGPWILVSYDAKYGHARYERPPDFLVDTDGSFPAP
jgi:hypothetical protein